MEEGIAKVYRVVIHTMKLQKDWQQKNSSVRIGVITSDLKAVEMASPKTMLRKVFYVSNTEDGRG